MVSTPISRPLSFLIPHRQGGLDARLLVSRLKPTAFTVKSITTIATRAFSWLKFYSETKAASLAHRGSPFADFLLDDIIGRSNVPAMLKVMKSLWIPGGGKAVRRSLSSSNLFVIAYLSNSLRT